MPMIDVYAAAGTFVDKKQTCAGSGECSDEVGGVPSTDLFKKNTAAFIHELPSEAIRMQPAITTTCAFRFLLQSMC